MSRSVIAGAGIGLNMFLLMAGGFRLCSECAGIDAFLAFPWAVLGLGYWICAAMLRFWRIQFAVAGLSAAGLLIATGLLAKGFICGACAVHFLILLSSVVFEFSSRGRHA